MHVHRQKIQTSIYALQQLNVGLLIFHRCNSRRESLFQSKLKKKQNKKVFRVT